VKSAIRMFQVTRIIYPVIIQICSLILTHDISPSPSHSVSILELLNCDFQNIMLKYTFFHIQNCISLKC